MKTRLLHFLDRLRESIWFLPMLCVVFALAFAVFARWMDSEVLDTSGLMLAGLQPGSPEGVRAVLSTIGSTMLGLAGVSFSITVVALSLASSQFGPRLLRNFTRDPRNHLVLGILMGVFVYALALLATVRSSETGDFETPFVGVSIAFLLALLGLGAFAFFVNNIAKTIQATHVVARVHTEVCDTVDRLFPDGSERDPEHKNECYLSVEEIGRADHRSRTRHPVKATESGYLQAVAVESLVEDAAKADVVVEVCVYPGSYLIQGTAVMGIYSTKRVTGELTERLADSLLQGDSRTTEHDFEFSIAQLVEIAARALSTGVNDPFTAMNCINCLGSALARISARCMPYNVFYDEAGQARVFLLPVTFPEILAAGVSQIRQNAKASPAVAIRVIEMLTEILPAIESDADRAAVLQQARATADGALSQPLEGLDEDAINQRMERIQALM